MQKDFRTLIDSARKGDNTAYTELFTATSEQMLGRARAMVKNEEDALDILQESYAYAFRSLDQLEHPEYFATWLYRIVTNRAKNFLVRYKPNLFEVQLMADDEGQEYEIEDEDVAFRPDESVDYDETKRIVRQIVDELPDDQRACILLYYFQDLKVAQIAEQLEISENTVKSRLSYARKKMKSRAEQYEREGTQLHGISFFPFLRWMFREETHAAAQESLGQLSAKLLADLPAAGAVPEASAAASSTSTASSASSAATSTAPAASSTSAAASTASMASTASAAASAAESAALSGAASAAVSAAATVGKQGVLRAISGKVLAGVLAACAMLYGAVTLYGDKLTEAPENSVLPDSTVTETAPEETAPTGAAEPAEPEAEEIDNSVSAGEETPGEDSKKSEPVTSSDAPDSKEEGGSTDHIAEDDAETAESSTDDEIFYIDEDANHKGVAEPGAPEFEYKEDFDPSDLGSSGETGGNGDPVAPGNGDLILTEDEKDRIYEVTEGEEFTETGTGDEIEFVFDSTEKTAPEYEVVEFAPEEEYTEFTVEGNS